MSLLFEEIDSQPSPLGEISLRRRNIPAFGDRPIYEVKLGDEFLMSSMFYDAEVALAKLGLAAIKGDNLRVVVGGLGLGYTAEAVLQESRVKEVKVIDALETVIQWHRDEKVPLGKTLNQDPRCQYVHASFFDLATKSLPSGQGFDQQNKHSLFDAILLDIDHSPTAFLNATNANFYTPEQLGKMAEQIRADGVFAMWSQDPPDSNFEALLRSVFISVESHIVRFYNPFQNSEASNTVYIAKKAA